MNLSDAINTSWIPRTKRKSKTPIQDRIRRAELLKNQWVAIIDLTEVDRGYTKHSRVLKQEMKKQTKPSLIDRFISFFKG